MNNKIISVIVILIIIAGGWLLYKNNSNSNTNTGGYTPISNDTTPSVPATTPTATPTSTTGTPATKSFTVTGGNYYFSPKTLTVNKGDKVSVTFVNSGGIHDFKIDEFNVATSRLEGGDKETVTFIADKSGTFEYYCSVGSHRAMGMVGTLTVI